MAANIDALRQWFQRGLSQGATHMIIVCDTFDWEDYPVFVGPSESVRKKEAYYRRLSMQKVMEVYHLGSDMEEQLRAGTRQFNYGEKSP